MGLALDLLRSFLIFSHLLLFGIAVSLVLWSDLCIVRGKLDTVDLKSVGHTVTRLFVGLWATGLTIIYLDTGFDPAVLAEKSKLLMKLVSVLVLTANAIVLHKICFSILAKDSEINASQAWLLSICGALSSSHWLMAAFVGSARMLNNYSFNTLVLVYGSLCVFILLIATLCTPWVRGLLNHEKESVGPILAARVKEKETLPKLPMRNKHDVILDVVL